MNVGSEIPEIIIDDFLNTPNHMKTNRAVGNSKQGKQ